MRPRPIVPIDVPFDGQDELRNALDFVNHHTRRVLREKGGGIILDEVAVQFVVHGYELRTYRIIQHLGERRLSHLPRALNHDDGEVPQQFLDPGTHKTVVAFHPAHHSTHLRRYCL